MNVAEFPVARFVLTSPIELGAVPDNRTTVGVRAEGDLTLRNVTRSVPVTIDAQILDDQLEIVGSVPVVFSDFDIDNPSVERIVSVRDEGLIEFRLLLQR